MSVKIRLRRVGAKKQPSYRVVVADSRSPRDGRFIEVIGFYNPRTKPTTITIDAEKARKWLGHGAQPTESVASLLYRAGIVDMRSPRYRGKEPPAAATGAAPAAEVAAPAEPVAEATAPAVEAAAETAAPVAEAAVSEAPGTPAAEAPSARASDEVEPVAAAETTPATDATTEDETPTDATTTEDATPTNATAES